VRRKGIGKIPTIMRTINGCTFDLTHAESSPVLGCVGFRFIGGVVIDTFDNGSIEICALDDALFDVVVNSRRRHERLGLGEQCHGAAFGITTLVCKMKGMSK
jgi:hypothetical protein